MKRHDDSKILPYRADEMFDLVADIEAYPDFLPWCKAARIRSREFESDGVERVDADLVIAFGAFRERFGSRVKLDRKAMQIDVNYLDGPFKTLRNQWRFADVEAGCQVDFFVEFEFKSKILQLAIGQVFEHAMMRIVHAFETRAQALYGRN